MKLNQFERDIIIAIGKHYPVILEVVDLIKVRNREDTGSGKYIDFEPINQPLESHTQLLDLHGVINLPNAQLVAHIEMLNGIP